MRFLVAAMLLCSVVEAKPKRSGQLIIVSAPSGAQITVDGEMIGPAPVTAADLLPGEHLIEALWNDGKSATTIAKVDDGLSHVVRLTPSESAPPRRSTLR